MRDQAAARLRELRAEFEVGQTRLHDLEVETTRLREALLRINGAIQVLEELLAPDAESDGGRPDPLRLNAPTTPAG
jgi:predicted nuclease with TOPRIM domain